MCKPRLDHLWIGQWGHLDSVNARVDGTFANRAQNPACQKSFRRSGGYIVNTRIDVSQEGATGKNQDGNNYLDAFHDVLGTPGCWLKS